MNGEGDHVRPNWVEIDLGVLKENIRGIRRHLNAHGGRSARLAAVVKADGYGHGAVEVGRVALKAGADWLCVAIVEEGLELREAGITAPILVLGWTPPRSAESAICRDLSVTVPTVDSAEVFSRAAARVGRPARVHFKVDTGMGRLGVPCDREGAELISKAANFPHLNLEGVFSHFSVADEDRAFTRLQLRRFRDFLGRLKRRGIDPPLKHIANSAAILDFPEAAFDLVRPGIMLYGSYPTDMVSRSVKVRPFLRWKTEVAQIKIVPVGTGISYGRVFITDRAQRIATLPTGYADGYPRLLSNRGEALIAGRRCPIAGRVCMDQTMVRLPDDLKNVGVGTEVTLLGSDGNGEISAEELADITGTIAHEIFTGISKRVPRVFVEEGRVLSSGAVLNY